MTTRAISSPPKADPWNQNLWLALKAAWLRPAPLFVLVFILSLATWILHRIL